MHVCVSLSCIYKGQFILHKSRVGICSDYKSILQNSNAKLFSFEYSKKILCFLYPLQMCLLDQTAYLVLLAVYVSCADRWLLCILCPCVYLTIGMLSYSIPFAFLFHSICFPISYIKKNHFYSCLFCCLYL